MLLKDITSNVIWIILSKLIKAVLVLIVTMFTARYLGPVKYGLLSYAASLVAFVTPIMQLGINSTIVYELKRTPHDEGEILGTSVVMCFISSILCFLGLISFIFIVNAGEKETIIVCALYGVLLIFQSFDIVQYWFQSKLLSKYVATTMIFSYTVLAFIQFYLLLKQKSIYLFAITNSIDSFLLSSILVFLYVKKASQRFKFSIKMCLRIFSKSKYYIISSIMITIFAQTDKVMLTLMCGTSANGYYSAAVTSANSTAFIFAAIIISFRPIIFESKTISQTLFESNIKTLFSLVVYSSLFVSLIFTFFSKIIIALLFGSEYFAAIPALRIIIWYTTFSYLGTIRDIWLLAEGKQKYIWVVNMIGAFLNVILNFVLIPRINIIGAAVASLMTQIFTNFLLGFIIKPIIRNNILLIQGLKISFLKSKIKQLNDIIQKGVKK